MVVSSTVTELQNVIADTSSPYHATPLVLRNLLLYPLPDNPQLSWSSPTLWYLPLHCPVVHWNSSCPSWAPNSLPTSGPPIYSRHLRRTTQTVHTSKKPNLLEQMIWRCALQIKTSKLKRESPLLRPASWCHLILPCPGWQLAASSVRTLPSKHVSLDFTDEFYQMSKKN